MIQNYKAAMIYNAHYLKKQTHQALEDGYFPIVLGGDKTQSIGSVSGMKKHSPNSKLILIDSRNDEQSNSPLTYLDGKSADQELNDFACLDRKDIALIGARDTDISSKDELRIGQQFCKLEDSEDVSALINRYFRSQGGHQDPQKFWVSLDSSSLSSRDFKSSPFNDENGLSLDFVMSLLEDFIPKSIGMDLSEVNFEMTSGTARHNDQQTVRELLELVVHLVNQPPSVEMDAFFSQEDIRQKL